MLCFVLINVFGSCFITFFLFFAGVGGGGGRGVGVGGEGGWEEEFQEEKDFQQPLSFLFHMCVLQDALYIF